MPPDRSPLTDAERDDLRRLYLAARGGTWEARILAFGQAHLYAVEDNGSRWLLAQPNGEAEARLMAATRNALPRLFAEIDRLRTAERGIPFLGEVR